MSTTTIEASSRTANKRDTAVLQKQRYPEFPNMNLTFENILKQSALSKATPENKSEASIGANNDNQGYVFVGRTNKGERVYKDSSGRFAVEFDFKYLVEAKPEQLKGLESD